MKELLNTIKYDDRIHFYIHNPDKTYLLIKNGRDLFEVFKDDSIDDEEEPVYIYNRYRGPESSKLTKSYFALYNAKDENELVVKLFHSRYSISPSEVGYDEKEHWTNLTEDEVYRKLYEYLE